ncbi:MAG TPA: PAS domain S-box protein [Kiritimatiellia bacterium]|nr:PAS domain S-box protein [Kiritimatiellia bacterium]
MTSRKEAADPPGTAQPAQDVRLHAAALRMADAAINSRSPHDLGEALHRIIGELIPARRFYLALYDAEHDMLRFPYWVDGYDPAPVAKRPGKGLTEHLLKSRKTLLLDRDGFAALDRGGDAQVLGTPPRQWLGTALLHADHPIGVIALQAYEGEPELTSDHQALLHHLREPITAAVLAKIQEQSTSQIEHDYHMLFSEMPAAFALFDVEWNDACKPVEARARRVNAAFERLINRPRGQFIGQPLSAWMPEHKAAWMSAFDTALHSGASHRMEQVVNGLPVQMLLYCPRPTQFAVILEDISQRRNADRLIARRDAMLTAAATAAQRFLQDEHWTRHIALFLESLGRAADASRSYIFEVERNPDGRWIASQRHEWVAAGIERQIDNPDMQKGDIVEMGFGRWISELQRGESISGTVDSLPAEEQPFMRAQDIQSIHVAPVMVGGRWWGFIGFDDCREPRDWSLSEREALRLAAQILGQAILHEHAQEQFRVQRTALGAAANGIVITDTQGRIQWVNTAFCHLTGYTADEALGKTPALLNSGQHELAFYKRMWETVHAGLVWRGEIVNRRKDGTLYTEEMTITPVRDAAGKLTHFIAIKQDITEQKNLRQQLLQAQKMESIGRLAGGIAHDFNNLLQAITGFSAILLSEIPEGDPRRADVQEIERAAHRAAALTRQLLTFGRKQRMDIAPLNLAEVVRGAEKMLRRLLPEHIRMTVELAPDLPLLLADAGQIEQILVNLSINARDAMPDGGHLRISTRAISLAGEQVPVTVGARAGNFACIEVEDEGCGMAPAVLEQVFEPFFSTKGPGKGTGLGLPVVYGIARQHNGFVDVRSTEGEGSMFRVFLPFPSEPAPAAPRPQPSMAQGQQLGGQGEHILVVEDEAGVRELTTRLLTGRNYRVTAVESIAQARALLAEPRIPYVLLFSDVVLADGNGLDLAEEAKQRHPALKVVLTSGYTNERERWAARISHLNGFLPKPYPPPALLRLLREVLDQPRTDHS